MSGLESVLVFAFAIAGRTADTAAVRGTVFDSIAAHPIAGASVQLARADSGHSEQYSASTDASGTFVIPGLPAGRYLAGFYHPLLDSLGLELSDRVIQVGAAGATIALGTPSPKTMLRAFCGDSSSTARPTLLFGHVHDARTESSIDNAPVVALWGEAAQTDHGLDIVDRTVSTTTHRAGLFALCGLPNDVSVALRVARGNDSAAVDVRLPESGVLHITLLMGTSGAMGRIAGRVLDRAQKRAVPSARASAANRGAVVNDAGRFVLDSVPTGTQSVDVRAIGYSPASVLVNVAEGSVAQVDFALDRVVTLPGVITRDSASALHLAEFTADKRRNAVATYFAEQTRLPGYKAAPTTCQLVTKASGRDFCAPPRGPTFSSSRCPAIVLNGQWTMSVEMSDIDPDDIIGVEYFPRGVPAMYASQFEKRPGACPFIVWTRCAGAVLPSCGANPESSPANRPPDDEEELQTLMRRSGEAEIDDCALHGERCDSFPARQAEDLERGPRARSERCPVVRCLLGRCEETKRGIYGDAVSAFSARV